MSSAIASGLRCRDLAISISRLAPASPRSVRQVCLVPAEAVCGRPRVRLSRRVAVDTFARQAAGRVAFRGLQRDADHFAGDSGRVRTIMIGTDARFVGIADVLEVPSVVVVVDVMRAFTVAARAFAQGAEKIVLAESLGEALALRTRHPDWVALKDRPPALGFDAVNSPGLLRSVDVRGRTVVLKTTAGTVGALAAKEVSLLLCAGFVVAEATAQLLRTCGSDSVTFMVTGEDGRADEDLACAQYIARSVTEPETDAAAFLRRAARRAPLPIWQKVCVEALTGFILMTLPSVSKPTGFRSPWWRPWKAHSWSCAPAQCLHQLLVLGGEPGQGLAAEAGELVDRLLRRDEPLPELAVLLLEAGDLGFAGIGDLSGLLQGVKATLEPSRRWA